MSDHLRIVRSAVWSSSPPDALRQEERKIPMVRLPMIAPLIAALLLTALAHEAEGARRSRPVRTGQTSCWNAAGAAISCAGTGQDGELQRGEKRAYLDLGNGTIRDQRTALLWEKLSDDGSIHDKDGLYSWVNAFAVKIAALNTPPCFAGFCDWRLPNRFELETLLNLGTASPAISTPFNTSCTPGCTIETCSCTVPSFHWSSSTYVVSGQTQTAWGVYFSDGYLGQLPKTNTYYVRAVRGGS
jgi:hypothetical protein